MIKIFSIIKVSNRECKEVKVLSIKSYRNNNKIFIKFYKDKILKIKYKVKLVLLNKTII